MMNVVKRAIFAVCLLILLPAGAGAISLSLDQCIQRAMVANPEIKAYQYAVQEAREGVGEAWGAFLPSVSVSYDHNRILNSSGQGTENDYFDQRSDRLVARLSQPVFAGFRGLAGLKRARQNESFRELELLLIRAELRRDVKIGFYDLLRAQALVEKRTESVERLRNQQEIAQAWVEKSLAPRIRLLEVQVELSNARQAVISAKAALATAMARLEEMLGMESGFTPEIEGSLDEQAIEPCQTVPACVDLGLARRLELELGTLNIKMAHQEARTILARNLPQARVDASWNDFQRDYETESLTDDVRDYYTVMFNVSISPFQGGRNIFAWRRQQAAISRLENILIQQRNGITTEIKSRFEQLNEGYARLETAEDTLNQAREAYDLTRHSVKLGVSSLRDLLDTQILLTEAQINQIDSYHALQVARAHLDFAVGN